LNVTVQISPVQNYPDITMQLEGKSALVTGGTRGIGRSIVVALAKAGADVALTYNSNEALAQEVVAEVEALGRKAKALKVDVSLAEQASSAIEETVKEFGKLDVLVNNAGVTKDTLLMRMSEGDWDLVIDTNLKGVFNTTKAAIRPMMSQKRGKVINITSVVALTGNPGQANYCASKAGVIGFTKSVAKEVASRNITVNSIAPGFIETDMTGKLNDAQKEALMGLIPLKRAGRPEDIANAVLFLASDAGDYITGQTLVVDGGMAM
jgi:3-oxoacyl-[acyl-carrier protein] reductase